MVWCGCAVLLVGLLAWRIAVDSDGQSDWVWAAGCAVAALAVSLALWVGAILRLPRLPPPRGDEAARQRKRSDNVAMSGAIMGTFGGGAIISQIAPTSGWLGFFVGVLIGYTVGISLVRRYLRTHPQVVADQVRRGYRV
jgi:4-amino-4-deoxy-L-arabinose transferase-like glycosyltransferase